MNILITGATGFIGRQLVPVLLSNSHHITVIGREKNKIKNIFSETVTPFSWDELNTLSPENYDIIIHLAGENIAEKRWTPKVKKTIQTSRVDTTKQIVAWCLKAKKNAPHVYLASAIGIYGLPHNKNTPHHDLTEESPIEMGASHDFLSEVGQCWEQAAQPLLTANIPLTLMRFAVVLKRGEGMLKKLELPFSLGLGCIIGDGQQAFSWIHIDDLIQGILFLMQPPSVTGPVNFVAPQIVSQRTFAHTLAKAMHRPLLLTIPKPVVKLMFGQMGEELLLSGQRVLPKRLSELQFQFKYPTLLAALTHEWTTHDGKK